MPGILFNMVKKDVEGDGGWAMITIIILLLNYFNFSNTDFY